MYRAPVIVALAMFGLMLWGGHRLGHQVGQLTAEAHAVVVQAGAK